MAGQVPRRAIDHSLTFEERRRDRMARRALRMQRERYRDAVLGAVGLGLALILADAAMWAWAFVHTLG